MSTAIRYSLTIDGEPASVDLLNSIKEVEVEDHAELADMLRLHLAFGVREDGSGWNVLDDAIFARLARIQLAITIGSGAAVPLIDSYVIETDAQFSSEPGRSVLSVVAMDPTVLMHLEEKVRPWPNMADSDVAAAVFSDAAYGFTPVTEATRWTRDENEQTLIQRGSDIQFLQQLAERNGYECFVALNAMTGEVEGHFHPPRHDEEPQGVLTVNMGAATNVDRMRVRYDMIGPTTATATTVEVDDASEQEGAASESSRSGLGAEPAAPHDRPRRVLLSSLGMGQAAEVQRYAQAVVDRSAWSILAEGELNTVAFGGILQAKKPVMVRGVGRTFSGRYYVEKVLHLITADGSYTQRFTLRRNATGLTGRESFVSDDAQAA